MSICLSITKAGATEIHIPVKPDSTLCDAGHIFTGLQTELIHYKIEEFKSRNYGLGIYVLTIDASYLPHLDTFISLVCNKWQICGDDNTCLIVLANNSDHDRYLFTGQKLNGRFNDTINDYIASIAHSQYKQEPESEQDPREIVEGMLDMINDRLAADPSSDPYNKELVNFKNGYGKTSFFGSSRFLDLLFDIRVWEVIGVLIGLIAGIITAVNAVRKV